jgi:hypothetical protein
MWLLFAPHKMAPSRQKGDHRGQVFPAFSKCGISPYDLSLPFEPDAIREIPDQTGAHSGREGSRINRSVFISLESLNIVPQCAMHRDVDDGLSKVLKEERQRSLSAQSIVHARDSGHDYKLILKSASATGSSLRATAIASA